MAKKKAKPTATPKDDLIESLMNDVQEISSDTTKTKASPMGKLFLDDHSQGQPPGLDDQGHPMSGPSTDAQKLWENLEEQIPSTQNLKERIWQRKATDNKTADEVVHEPPAKPTEALIDNPHDDEVTFPVGYETSEEGAAPPTQDEKTININASAEEEVPPPPESSPEDAEKTVAVEGFANLQKKREADASPRLNFGGLRNSQRPIGGGVYTSADATLMQAESLKLAQQRILELEKEVEKYRQENEELASAGDIIRNRSEELTARLFALEKEKGELAESLNNELIIVKSTAQYKDGELLKARQKIEELEIRLKADFKKIRVRERELENRLELVKAEKTALLRAKDENILDLKRKIDHLQSELDNYRSKVLELNKNIDMNQEQFKRTVRALRLALSNLESKDENLVPLKKAD